MALWGKYDETESKPKYLNEVYAEKAVFVSVEEAQLKTNKDKGITGAGWWLVNEYVDSSGSTRYKTENLIAMAIRDEISGDSNDDAKVADVEIAITINAQPANDYFWQGHSAEFTVDASVNEGNLTYQWQKKAPGEGTRWTNIAEATSATYNTGDTLNPETDNNTQFRVVLGSDSGAAKVYSDAALAIVD